MVHQIVHLTCWHICQSVCMSPPMANFNFAMQYDIQSFLHLTWSIIIIMTQSIYGIVIMATSVDGCCYCVVDDDDDDGLNVMLSLFSIVATQSIYLFLDSCTWLSWDQRSYMRICSLSSCCWFGQCHHNLKNRGAMRGIIYRLPWGENIVLSKER